jgi:ABC-type multidrug transport system ATPase subunit
MLSWVRQVLPFHQLSNVGSGKSSLLNILCRRLHGSLTSRYHYSGELLFNNTAPTDNVIRALTSYVVQDDTALLPSLTVRETLQFAAIIRLPPHMTKSQKVARAEEVLAQLGLRHCADTLVGSEFVKGISGGEKRRVSIAIQILTDPKILMLDEPSSGLDANTAHSMIELLEALAKEGRTIICTIHQSRSDLFPLFGNLLLLASGGRMIYSGKGEDMIGYFEHAGFPCPTFANPAYAPM